MRRKIAYVTAIAAVATYGLTAAACRADRAVVVGINTYPNLTSDAQLDGSVNDANLMTSKLKQVGFDVTEITDTDAARGKVLNALARMQSQVKPSERFVFYFAGHGAKKPDGDGVLLASDANQADQTGYISRDELYGAVSTIPGSSHTIILDSCFSGALARGLFTKGIHLHSRFYNFFGSEPPRVGEKRIVLDDSPNLAPVVTNLTNTNTTHTNTTIGTITSTTTTTVTTPIDPKLVCYFTASNPAQKAYEDDFDGTPDGVFTHFLAARLTAPGKEPWSAIQADVTADVLKDTEDNEAPVLSPNYAQVAVFDSAADPVLPPHRAQQSVWQTFSENIVDPGRLSLKVDPDFTSIKLGARFHFAVTTGDAGGYLVVLEMDTDGHLDLLYPARGNVADAKIAGGDTNLPTDPRTAYKCTTEGAEQVKALLFKSAGDAATLLDAFPKDTLTIPSAAAAQAVNVELSDNSPFVSSTVDFTVVAAE